MAEVKPGATGVNFLAQDEFEGKAGGKFLRWALSWGKKIVVLTELVVILAFLSRFWLDTQSANLSDEIDKQKNIVLASASFEKVFRSLTLRVDRAKAIEGKVSPVSIYDQAMKIIPTTVTLAQINTTDTTVNLSGDGSETAIADLVAAFQNSPSFTDINVVRISKTDINPGINFALSATFVKVK